MTTSQDTNQQATNPQPAASRWRPWRRGATAVGLVAGGFVLGAATLASADGGPWHGGGHWGHWGAGAKVGFFQHIVRNRLDAVGATTAQEDKIHDIIATTYTELDAGKGKREAMRKQVLDLMRAPTIDRAAVEKLRAERIAAFDAKSKKIVGAFLDAAGQLTPEQRAKLVQQAEEHMAHRGWHRWGHDGQDRDGQGRDGGPDHGPDDRGDHG